MLGKKHACICRACGKTAENGFSFCPWCSTALASGPQEKPAAVRIRRMEADLLRLEQELTGFLESRAAGHTP
ncbi:MAG: hypothetical protein IAA96_06535 [Spirochaetes bacterium]|uniref:Zinc ribbon domain-containing protein n=1 Tax=Candidatus Avitreponema avistercoris TaxID=2840705 RepID=A0A9D9EPJ7_9SPIR|nr:hypothetical protein [Candidatus Avitreponema avistercoris]